MANQRISASIAGQTILREGGARATYLYRTRVSKRDEIKLIASGAAGFEPLNWRFKDMASDTNIVDRTYEVIFPFGLRIDKARFDKLQNIFHHPCVFADLHLVISGRTAGDFFIKPTTKSVNRAFREH